MAPGRFVLLRPCTTSAGFTATPERTHKLDMQAFRASIEEAGYEVVIDARVMLLVRKDVESSVYSSGKVLLKTTNRDAAQAAYDDLRPFLERHW